MSDKTPLWHWPDGQVRQEAPYRCGAFDTATGEQCLKLSDHDGPHQLASDSPLPPSGSSDAPSIYDSCWPPHDVVQTLADAADHLMKDHDCDQHGWERVGFALKAARVFLATPPARRSTDTDLFETVRAGLCGDASGAERDKAVAALYALAGDRFRYNSPTALPTVDGVHGVCWLLMRGDLISGRPKVLLERCPKKAAVLGVGEWFVPGGKVELSDGDALDTLFREVGEEWPDARISDTRPLPILAGSAIPPGPRGLFLMQPYVITVAGDVPGVSADGVELRWVAVDEALASPVPQVRMMVAAAFAARATPPKGADNGE